MRLAARAKSVRVISVLFNNRLWLKTERGRERITVCLEDTGPSVFCGLRI